MSSATVIVTGGAGYIGSHACKALAEAGYLPVSYDSLCRGNEWAVRWGPLERGDVRDGARLRAVLRKHAPACVLHFAALAYVGESVDHPSLYYDNNVGGTLSLLEAMRAEGAGRLVFSSSCATYGVPAELPVSEGTPQAPVSPYGMSKLMAEQIIAEFAARHGLSAVLLRYFNAAGADPGAEIGECHQPETHLIPLMLAAARRQAAPLAVFGDDCPTPDGTCIRDYIHVADLAAAHVKAVQRLLGGHSGMMALNLGAGTGLSVKQLIAAAERVTGHKVPHVYRPRRPGDPAALIAEARLAREALGWEPRHSGITDILRTAWNWMDAAPR